MIVYKSIPRIQLISAVLWPSFLLASVATSVFFVFLDPVRLLDYEGEAPLSRMAAYSLGFFLFWLLCAASSAATAYFMRPTDSAVPSDDGSA